MLTLPINVAGELQAVCGSEALNIRAQGGRIVVNIPNLRAGMVSAGSLGARKNRVRILSRLDSMARLTGLTVDVHLADRRIAEFGSDVSRSGTAKMLAHIAGLGPIRIRSLMLLRTAMILLFRG